MRIIVTGGLCGIVKKEVYRFLHGGVFCVYKGCQTAPVLESIKQTDQVNQLFTRTSQSTFFSLRYVRAYISTFCTFPLHMYSLCSTSIRGSGAIKVVTLGIGQRYFPLPTSPSQRRQTQAAARERDPCSCNGIWGA